MGPLRQGVATPTKAAHTPCQCKQSDKPLCFGFIPPVPQMPYTQGLATLVCTMRVNTPKQSIYPFKTTHKVPASHSTVHNALAVCY